MHARQEEQYNADIMANDIVDQLKKNLGMDVKIQAVPQSNFVRPAVREQVAAGLHSLVVLTIRIRTTGTATCSTARRRPDMRQAWSNKDFDDLVIAGQGRAGSEQTARHLPAGREDHPERRWIHSAGLPPRQLCLQAMGQGRRGQPVQGYTVPDGNIYVRMLTKAYIEGRDSSTALIRSSVTSDRDGHWPSRFHFG